jgi:P4 family phage/plasmid primase-like protien
MHDADIYPLLSKFDGVSQKSPAQWYALCPCHDDRKNSLGIAKSDGGRLVLNCLAGCETPEILRAIGASWSDLFPRRDRHTANYTNSTSNANHVTPSGSSSTTPKPKPRIVKNYNYPDESGTLLFQVVRFEPKDFRQRRPNPDRPGDWLWKMDGVRRVLYRLPSIVAAPLDTPIFVVEGEKDADRLTISGLTATTIPGGAGKWQDSYGESLRGRVVVLIPDNDRPNPTTGRRPGWDHVVCIANALIGVAASVRVLNLPNDEATFPADRGGPLTPKWDVSDWLDRGGTRDQFFVTLDATPEWQREAAPGDPEHPDTQPQESEDDPHRLAKLFLGRFQHPDGLTLRFWRDAWWRWSGLCCVNIPAVEIRAEIVTLAKSEFDRLIAVRLKTWVPAKEGEEPPKAKKVTTSIVNNVLLALQGEALLPATVEQPTWIDLPAPSTEHPHTKFAGRSPVDFIALENGILDVHRMMTSDDTPDLIPHTPRWFSPVALAYTYNPEGECPKWDAFLARNLGGDHELIAMLQEWFGYCLTPDTSIQRFLFLEGEGSNGKSVVCAVLTAVLGPDNVSHVSLEMFAKDFVLTQTLGKLANIAAEVGEIDKMAEGYLKSFTAGDRMTFNRKNQSLIEATPTARLVLSANNRPRFSDRSEGIWRRMLMLPLTVTIAPHERVYGMDKPEWWRAQGELPGILNWALAGLWRLRNQRGFTIPEASRAALDDYKQDANPARRFLLENFEEDVNGTIITEEVYGAYRAWCDRHGNKPFASNIFAKEILRVFKKIESARLKNWDGKRKMGYIGIEVKTESEIVLGNSEIEKNSENGKTRDSLFD